MRLLIGHAGHVRGRLKVPIGRQLKVPTPLLVVSIRGWSVSANNST
jgi:hypothetical protein